SPPIENGQGQALRITRLAALISCVALVRADGGTVRLDGQYGFIDAEGGRLAATMRTVPEGAYAGIELQIRVPPAVNHGDVARWPAEHALNPLVNGLHWSWQGGYVFFALEGRWRQAGETERGFSYHLATDARLMSVRMRSDFEVKGDTTLSLAL